MREQRTTGMKGARKDELCKKVRHLDPTRLRLVKSGSLRSDSRPDCTFQQGATNNTRSINFDTLQCNTKKYFFCSLRTKYEQNACTHVDAISMSFLLYYGSDIQ